MKKKKLLSLVIASAVLTSTIFSYPALVLAEDLNSEVVETESTDVIETENDETQTSSDSESVETISDSEPAETSSYSEPAEAGSDSDSPEVNTDSAQIEAASTDGTDSDSATDEYDQAEIEYVYDVTTVDVTIPDDYFEEAVIDTSSGTVSADGEAVEPETVADELDSNMDTTEDAEIYLQSVGYDVEESGDELVVSSQYQIKRLIVFSDTLDSVYKASSAYYIVSGGYYILNFDSVEDTEEAYLQLQNSYSCMVDKVFYAEDVLEANSWGYDYMGFSSIDTSGVSTYVSGTEVVVAVIDTGLTSSASDIFTGRVLQGHDYGDNDDDPTDDAFTDTGLTAYGHGTHVAGIIAECTTSNVKILPVKIFNSKGSATTTMLLNGITYAVDQGADVINMSIGDKSTADDFSGVDSVLKKAYDSGIILVAAAGNEKSDVSGFYPANSSYTIAVSALNTSYSFASYSNYGEMIDFTAPGSYIYSTLPNGTVGRKSGTSQAAPHVSAAFAMLKSMYPAASYSELYQMAVDNCTDFGDAGKDIYYGYGSINIGNIINTYVQSQSGSGGDTGETGEETAVTVTVSDIDNAAGTCEITISGADDTGIKGITVPVWSSGDQNDIYWYTAVKQSDGTYKVSMNLANHKYNTGHYYIHVYAIDNSNVYTIIGESSVEYSVSSANVSESSTSSGHSISVSGISVPGGLKSVYYAVWSQTDGQDDIIWFNGSYSSSSGTASYSYNENRFSTYGKYYVHVYGLNMSDTMVFLGSTEYNVDTPSADSVAVTAVSNSAGTFTVTLSGLSSVYGVNSVSIPVWSKSDQSDIVWYTATRNSSGNYVVNGNISNHSYHLGSYYIHAYVVDSSGRYNYVGNTSVSFSTSYSSVTLGNGTNETTYPISISGVTVPGGLSNLYFAVWSNANGQDDIVWYNGTASGSTYRTTIDIRNHKTTGAYSIHIYGVTKSGEYVQLAVCNDLNINPSVETQISTSDISAGSFTVTVKPTNASSGISTVLVPVWCNGNQSDIKWYTANRQPDGTYQCTVNISDHAYESGVFYIHVYATFNNGIMIFTNGITKS